MLLEVEAANCLRYSLKQALLRRGRIMVVQRS
jgi:hypothetical protein